MDRFESDSVLLPLNFPSWIKGKFGPSVYKRAQKTGMGILALKAMAHRSWPENIPESKRKWNKTFYEPFDEIDKAALRLRFTLHLPVTAMFPPGHWELFKMALDLTQAGALVPLNDEEQKPSSRLLESLNRSFRCTSKVTDQPGKWPRPE